MGGTLVSYWWVLGFQKAVRHTDTTDWCVLGQWRVTATMSASTWSTYTWRGRGAKQTQGDEDKQAMDVSVVTTAAHRREMVRKRRRRLLNVGKHERESRQQLKTVSAPTGPERCCLDQHHRLIRHSRCSPVTPQASSQKSLKFCFRQSPTSLLRTSLTSSTPSASSNSLLVPSSPSVHRGVQSLQPLWNALLTSAALGVSTS